MKNTRRFFLTFDKKIEKLKELIRLLYRLSKRLLCDLHGGAVSIGDKTI